MAEKANQHYVPQFYFRYFSENGKSIELLNRKSGKVVSGAPIKGQASKKYFYGDKAVEDALSRIETHFCRALIEFKKTHDLRSCSIQTYGSVLQNLMLQSSRTASARSKSKGMNDRFYQLFLECAVNNDQTLTESERAVMVEAARTAVANEKESQATQMEIAVEQAGCLFDLYPLVIENKTNRPFIFGDAPVVKTNPFLKQVTTRGVLGGRSAGLMVIYPLSPTKCLILLDVFVYRIKKFRDGIYPVRSLSDVAALNKLQLHNALSTVYFHDDKYSKYVESLWNDEKLKLFDHQGRVVEAPGKYHYGEDAGDILHAYEPQLPFIPKFSFLDYEEVLAEEFDFFTRDDYV
ncbi:DUF4238 domain-containing protein [Vibrio splendidus]|uniref:DUF4238 domain-containing protein n=1 Tax=Vibrio splendidus TaxID=29497 RepID=UPI000C81C51E|nr:DUF4238 domain-containing protein [Vibrio splendidus]PMP48874.1 hypothetical protein BCS86_04730 [Vibrio splendidus]